MAQHKWARLKSNDSLERRNCHSAVVIDFTIQATRAAEIHERYLVSGKRTCHKGIAHELPDMTGIAPGRVARPELGGERLPGIAR